MSIDINEMRALVEAAKKRGAIREAGDTQPPVSTPAPSSPEPPKEVVLPEWLREGFNPLASTDKPRSPEWR